MAVLEVTDCDLSVALIRWEIAREKAAELREARAAIECEHVSADETAAIECSGFLSSTPPTPCWKDWRDGIEDRTLAPQSEWCESCRARQRIHEQYRAATTHRGAKLREMRRLAKLAMAQGALWRRRA